VATYDGACHCGAVAFRVQVEEHEAIACDCSICLKKGYLHLIVEPDAFELVQGEEALTAYRFGTGIAVHRFCRTCGIHPFYTPRSHPDAIDVNVNCLAPEVIERFSVKPFHGQAWDKNVHTIR